MVYERLEEYPCLLSLIIDANLFDSEKIANIISNDLHFGIQLLKSNKSKYFKDDLMFMKKIQGIINCIPDAGKIETQKSGVFGRESVKYICPNNHKNKQDVEFCEFTGCGLNIKGLTLGEIQIIERFNKKVTVLENHFDFALPYN